MSSATQKDFVVNDNEDVVLCVRWVCMSSHKNRDKSAAKPSAGSVKIYQFVEVVVVAGFADKKMKRSGKYVSKRGVRTYDRNSTEGIITSFMEVVIVTYVKSITLSWLAGSNKEKIHSFNFFPFLRLLRQLRLLSIWMNERWQVSRSIFCPRKITINLWKEDYSRKRARDACKSDLFHKNIL